MSFFDRILKSLEGIFTGRRRAGDVDETIQEPEVTGWYLSGLQYERNIGITIFGDYDIDEAEDILRDYAEANLANYNNDFYGIAEIGHNGESLRKVIEVNL